MLQAAPLMAITLLATPTREADKPIHARHRFETYFQILQAPSAKLPPVVDHLIVAANVSTFITYKTNVIAGVKILSEKREAAESIDVRVHKDTGLEISTTTSGSFKNERMVIEVLLPTPYALGKIKATGSGTIVVEDQVLPINDPYAHVRLHAGGFSKILVTSQADINIQSLQLLPQGVGTIQLQAPSLTLRETLQASVAGKGVVHLAVDRLKLPAASIEASGCADVNIAAREIEITAELSIASEGMGSISVLSGFMRADRLQMSTHGKGKLAVVSSGELVANYVDLTAHGMGELLLHAPAAVCNASRITVHGMGVINASSLLARDVGIEAHGMGKAHFRATEAARTNIHGMAKATIYEPLPPRLLGNPIIAADAPTAAMPQPHVPVVIPQLSDAFAVASEAASPGVFSFITSIWAGPSDHAHDVEDMAAQKKLASIP